MKKLYDNQGNCFAELNYSKKYFLDYSKHSHDSFSLCVFSKGEVEVEFHTQEEELVSSSEIIIFNPNQVHQTKSEIKKTEDYYTLHVDTQWCKNIQEKLFGFNEKFLSTQNIISEESISKKLLIIFQNITMYDERNNKDLEEIVTYILEKYTILDLNTKDKEEHTMCKKVEEYILNNLEEQITLEDIAIAVGYNDSYITRIFKKEYGLSPYAFLVDKRIQKAKNRLLDDSEINLAQLSNEIGFYDQSHFSKVFKRTFATTPNKYRNKIK